uniref:Uncharacterized protein n=1 Tax=Oryza meridionalis TaxID=40149 RepID=A0A0E0E9X1_9ORYZ
MEGEDGSSSRRVTKKRRGASRQEQGAEPEIDASVRGPLVKRPNFDCDCERPHPNSPRKRQCRSNSDCPSGSKDLKLSGLGAPELNPCDEDKGK